MVMPDVPGKSAVIWHVQGRFESQSDVFAGSFFSKDELAEYETIGRASRRREWLAVRVALKKMLLDDGVANSPASLFIRKDERGCPYVVLWEPQTGRYERIPCSFAHKGAMVFAAYAHDHSRRIGIDIERRSWRIAFLKKKFVSQDDCLLAKGDDMGDDTILWSFKEAASKLLGSGYGCGFTTISCRETGPGVCELSRASDCGAVDSFTGRYSWFGRYVITLVMDPPGDGGCRPSEMRRRYGYWERFRRGIRLREVRRFRLSR